MQQIAKRLSFEAEKNRVLRAVAESEAESSRKSELRDALKSGILSDLEAAEALKLGVLKAKPLSVKISEAERAAFAIRKANKAAIKAAKRVALEEQKAKCAQIRILRKTLGRWNRTLSVPRIRRQFEAITLIAGLNVPVGIIDKSDALNRFWEMRHEMGSVRMETFAGSIVETDYYAESFENLQSITGTVCLPLDEAKPIRQNKPILPGSPEWIANVPNTLRMNPNY
jgi:hypothetical protein